MARITIKRLWATFLLPAAISVLVSACTKPNLVSTAPENNYDTPTPVGTPNSSSTAYITTLGSVTNPAGIAVDAAGYVYVADSNNSVIRVVSPGGQVSTLAGGSGALFSDPIGVAVDQYGTVYVADAGNNEILKISGGVASIFAGQPGSGTSFSFPAGVAVDSAGFVFVADCYNSMIREISPGGTVTTLAGQAGSPGAVNGSTSSATFWGPYGVAVDNYGNVYVGDSYNNMIRKISGGWISTLAGSGTPGSSNGFGSNASFSTPEGVAVDGSGNVYVADFATNLIRKITSGGDVSTLAGPSNSTVSATFNNPVGVAVDGYGHVFVGDSGDNEVREIFP